MGCGSRPFVFWPTELPALGWRLRRYEGLTTVFPPVFLLLPFLSSPGKGVKRRESRKMTQSEGQGQARQKPKAEPGRTSTDRGPDKALWTRSR